jgi:hypothetical protein
VTLLSSLIPGFRSLRTPVAAGLMWLCFTVILVAENNRHTHLDSSAITSLSRILPGWFSAVALPTIIAVSYVLGSVAVGITSVIMREAGHIIRRSIVKLDEMVTYKHRIAWHLVYRAEAKSRPDSVLTRSLVIDAIINTMVEAGAPSGSALIFPFDHAIEALPLNAAQLSQTSPSQYQEYDRLKAESEFRVAIVPPLIALAAVLPLRARPWLIIVALIASTTLLLQAIAQMRNSNDILANAAYLGYIKLVQVKAVSEYLRNLKEPPISEGQWIGAIIVGLRSRGFYEEADSAVHELLEFVSPIRKEAVAYMKTHDKESADFFNRLMRQRTARHRESTNAAKV